MRTCERSKRIAHLWVSSQAIYVHTYNILTYSQNLPPARRLHPKATAALRGLCMWDARSAEVERQLPVSAASVTRKYACATYVHICAYVCMYVHN
jgi:hypothetical protein